MSTSVNKTTMSNDKSKAGGNKPDPYDGNLDNYREFVNRFNIYADLVKDKYDTAEKKILLFLSFLIGEASYWAENWRDSQPKDTTTGATNYGTFTAMFEEFERAYQPTDRQQAAEYEIDRFKQGTMRVSEFITQFKCLARQADYLTKATVTNQPTDQADRQLRARFQKALHPRLLATILDQPRANQPKTFAEWCTTALEREDDWRVKQRAMGSALQRQARSTNLRTTTTDETPKTISRLTEEQWAKARKEGLCYRCQKKGHLVKDCTLPPPNRTAGPSRPPPFQKKKEDQKPKKNMTGKQVYRRVRSMAKQVSPEELQKFEHYMENGLSDEEEEEATGF
ncbi:hypothetical protein EST38_g5089 [Candolleomyces aberdarensis]|uniref:CCHC-type domain-containing protein n=1 Tax=Candolleomyces aberdarensis TaxID=2316362 RepID=A0A4Q2DNN0_9AGAR|nr:hypothetical protein EST38_g5089 [Candolleomyces aberdarensis]